jgi:hypothetical protein
MFECEICKQKPPEVCVFRANKPGEMPARWRCREHLTEPQIEAVGEDVFGIVNAIEEDKLKAHEDAL